MRLFVAISLPDDVVTRLLPLQSGVIGARWQTRERLHLTLRFIGEVGGHVMRDIDDMLSAIHAPPLALDLKGVGEFGHDKPNALWAGVGPTDALRHLQRKIERAVQQAGIAPEKKKYSPHITLARLRGTPPGIVMDWLTDHALFAAGPFDVDAFGLYSSQLTSDGSKYRLEREYTLG
jgi:2'-5' RNA ligase